MSVAVRSDGRLIASGSADMSIRVFDLGSRKDFGLYGQTGWVRSVAFSPNGPILASGGSDGAVRLWNLNTHTQIATLLGHLGPVLDIAFHPSGEVVMSSGQDQTVREWEVATRREVRQLEGAWEAPKIARFGSDLGAVVLEGDSGIQVFSGSELKYSYPEATALGMTRDGRMIVAGQADGSVWLNRESPKHVATIPARVRGLVFSGDGTVLAVQSEDAKTIHVFSLDAEGNASPGGEFSTDDPSWYAAMDDSGNSIAMCGTRDGKVYSRDHSFGTITIHRSAEIIGMTFDAFRQPVLLFADQSVEFVGSPKPRIDFRPRARQASRLAAASEDGSVFAFAQQNGDVYVTSAHSEPLLLRLGKPLLAIAFSRDGNRLGTLDRTGAVRVYEIRRAGRNWDVDKSGL